MSLPKSAGKPNLSQKTREEIKAEREAKKAAKTAAKAAKINSAKADNVKNAVPVANCKIPVRDAKVDVATEKDNKVVETDKIKNKSVTANCEIEKSTKTDIATNATGSQLNKETLKENVNQSSNVVQNGASKNKNEGKSKAELRAERRAKQEAQRAAKQQQLAKDNVKSEKSLKPHIETAAECSVKKSDVKNAKREDAHAINLFKHLYQERKILSLLVNIATVNSNIHPAIVRLGVQYANKVIVGSNARCVALLAAIKQMVQDFEKPVQADFIRGLEVNLKESLAYLNHCRPLGVSMHNAMRHLNWQMTQFSSTLSDEKVSCVAFCFCQIIIFL